MTPALRHWLLNCSPKERAMLTRDCRKALRKAWPNRHTSFRAPMVVRDNVTMLRNLREITSGAVA